MAETDAWKPIGSAPKDGTKIVVWYDGFGEVTVSWADAFMARKNPDTGNMERVFGWMNMGAQYRPQWWREPSLPPPSSDPHQGRG